MKTENRTVFFLALLLMFTTHVVAGDFFGNRANVWLINSDSTQSFSIGSWTNEAQYSGGSANIETEEGDSFSIEGVSTRNIILVNNVEKSFPKSSANLPKLSFTGLSQESNSDLSTNEPSISISPEGGEFNETIEVTFTLNAVSGSKHVVFYSINEAEQESRELVAKKGGNKFSIFLSKKGEYTIEYGLKKEKILAKTNYFSLKNALNNRDSDDDGIPDSVEIELGLNPLSSIIPDSDNDGWNDFDEYLRDTNKNKKNSKPKDSDLDGWSDFDEKLRGTDPLNSKNCIDKPTVTSLYEVEYLLTNHPFEGEDNNSAKLTNITQMKLVNLQAKSYFDSNKRHVETNSSLCQLEPNALKTALSLGNIPALRASAKIPLISKIIQSNEANGSNYIIKAFTPSKNDATLRKYLLSTQFSQLSQNDFNALDFKRDYIAYLEVTLLQKHTVMVERKSSIKVGLLEATLTSRVDTKSTLYLGNSNSPIVYEAYQKTLTSIQKDKRGFNELYRDIVLMMENKQPNLESTLLTLYSLPLDINHTSETDITNALQNDLTLQNKYYLSLMTIVDFNTTQNHATLFSMTSDSDEDGLTNEEEVLPVYYTHPLQADSDNDHLNDADDLCPLDANNRCLNNAATTIDSDEDGVLDSIDNCPFTANSEQNDSNTDGIGDICSQGGIVIVQPRINIQIFQGESITFIGQRTNANQTTPLWSLNHNTITTATPLSYSHTFSTLGEERVCLGFETDKELSCINITILEQKISNPLNIYTQEVYEGDEKNSTLLVEVVLKYPSKMDYNYHYSLKPLTATKNVDYVDSNGTITFQKGQKRNYFNIVIIGDKINENNETFEISIDKHYLKEITIIDDDQGENNVSTSTDNNESNQTEENNSTYYIKKTGQVKSYNQNGDEITDSSIKDDGFYQKGLNKKYVSDTEKMLLIDEVSQLIWQDNADSIIMKKPWIEFANHIGENYANTTGDTASNYCNTLSLAEHTDWRIPTIIELSTMVNYNSNHPALDIAFQFKVDGSATYWAESNISKWRSKFWTIESSIGNTVLTKKWEASNLRCVRKQTPTSVFVPNVNMGIVLEETNNLMWQDNNDSNTHVWESAINTCESLAQGGYNDWRLPNINELKSIYDYIHKSDNTEKTYWSSTSQFEKYNYAWSISSKQKILTQVKSSLNHIRCVRDN